MPEPDTEHPIVATTAAAHVMVGTSVLVPPPAPLISLTTLSRISSPDGLAFHAANGQLGVEAASDLAGGAATALLVGTGCIATRCGVPFEVTVPVDVSPLSTPPEALESFTTPSVARIAEAEGDALRDEVLITVGTPQSAGTREQAEAAAKLAGAVVVGGLQENGVYELRWPTPQDLPLRIAQLEGQPGVTSATEVPMEPTGDGAAAPITPSFDEPKWLWPYEQVEAEGAWDLSTGSSVRVGIIDMGLVMNGHNDLNLAGYLSPPTIYFPAEHATHVAGLACAKGGVGTVGMAWGCPIVSTEVGVITGYSKTGQAQLEWTPQSVLAGMRRMLASGDVKVINLSLGIGDGCTTAAQNAATEQHDAPALKRTFRQIMDSPAGQEVVWTIAAGNRCSPLVANPFGLNSDLNNVITVAATNSDEGLASFSDYGPDVNVAAPGGQAVPPELPSTSGLMSTLPVRCPEGYCSTYGEMEGTSMAAPVVAGIAADVWQAHPGFTADHIGNCIKTTAGANGRYEFSQDAYPLFDKPVVPFSGAGIPIADAEAAVECGTYVPRNLSPPTIHSEQAFSVPNVGDTLVGTEGRWTGRPTDFTYEWERCAPSAGCSLLGATGSTYVVRSADLGDQLRVIVRATNSAGTSAPAISAESVVIGESSVLAQGPTAGPIGFEIPIVAPTCQAPAGSSANINVLMDGGLYELLTPNGHAVEHNLVFFYKGSVGTHNFTFNCGYWSGGTEHITWSTTGFAATITGPGKPLAVGDTQVALGQTVLTSSGVPRGPEPCPEVPDVTWSAISFYVVERVGSIARGETFYFPAGVSYSLGELNEHGATAVSLVLPESIRSEGRWELHLVCHAQNASPDDTAFSFTAAGLTVEPDSLSNSLAPLLKGLAVPNEVQSQA
jgi:subtilisin family serine protease